ncbi:hypothetical protein [Nocardia sp. NPDC051463]|uniref:hypothetical protein n=1 Tax=Nocardia sp. NPDC051463 TaxID=3154845 RepID=UPI00344D1ED3
MGAVELVSSLVGSLAWPVFVVIIVWMLRTPITRALTAGPIARLKAGATGVEIEWDRLDHARTEVGEPATGRSARADDAAPAAPRDVFEQAHLVADIEPRAAILTTFASVDILLRELIGKVDDPNVGRLQRRGGTNQVARFAVERGLLSPPEADVVYELSLLRGQIAHADDVDVSGERAHEYIDLARRIADAVASTLRVLTPTLDSGAGAGSTAPATSTQ